MAKGENISQWISNIGSAVNSIKTNPDMQTKGLFGGTSKKDLELEIELQAEQMKKMKTWGMVGIGALMLFCLMMRK